MKKIFILFVLLLIVSSCNEITISKIKEENKNITILSDSKLKKKIDDEETFILLLTKNDCSSCKSLKEKLDNVLRDYNLEGYEINVDNIDTKENEYLKNIVNVVSYPSLVFIEKGKEKGPLFRLVGDIENEKIINALVETKYIDSSEKKEVPYQIIAANLPIETINLKSNYVANALSIQDSKTLCVVDLPNEINIKDLHAYADLSNLEEGNHEVEIYVKSSTRYLSYSCSPQKVNVKIYKK